MRTKKLLWGTFIAVFTALVISGALVFTGCREPESARPAPTRYTVTFDPNGNTSGSVTSAMIVNLGSSITLPSGSGLSRTDTDFSITIPSKSGLTRTSYIFGGWNTNASGTGTNYDAGSSYKPTGNITLYAKWNAAEFEVVFNDLSGNDIYLIRVNTSDSIVNAAGTGSVNDTISVIQNIVKNSLSFGELPRMGHPSADAFRANHPPIVAQAPRTQRAVFVAPVVGDTRNFWVETFFYSGVFVEKQATLMAAGQRGNIWVIENKITDAQAQTLADKFDLIYPLETNLLGYEYGGGIGGDGGKDGDLKIQILVYDLVDDSGAVVSGGFFWGKDFFDDSQLGIEKSNLAEIFYIDASYVISNPEYIYSVLVHEFQHMINFNVKSVKYGVNPEVWYDEMLSTMAQDVIDPLIGITLTNSNHVINLWMPAALNNYYLEGVTEWNYTDSSNSYARTFAFGAYLLRNYGGAELLQRILANDTADIESITAALNQFSSGLTFEQALKRYGEAMIFSGSSMPEGVMSFDKTVTETIYGRTYTAYGFDIWNDFEGPAVLDLRQRGMMPHSITIHSTDGWKNLTGNFSITLNRPSDPNVVFYLMVK
jgi:uncharacterized repeat protein (TIGR02543 family)